MLPKNGCIWQQIHCQKQCGKDKYLSCVKKNYAGCERQKYILDKEKPVCDNCFYNSVCHSK